MQLKNHNIIQGFTLIEMLVSITLFSIVITATLGSIMTISDSNKKARSLMSVTNNLNFAVDSMVRSFKTGEADAIFISGNCFITQEIKYDQQNFTKQPVQYCFEETNGKGVIKKDGVNLTSSDVDIDELEFIDTSLGTQPMLTIVMKGTVKVSEKISSAFSIQTSVSQRKLKF